MTTETLYVFEHDDGRYAVGPEGAAFAVNEPAWHRLGPVSVAVGTEDAARLDFIEKHARVDPKMDGQHVYWPTTFNNRLCGPNLRAAIDKARKEQS